MSTELRPILLATDDSKDVFAFWQYHKQCGIDNQLDVAPDGDEAIRYLEGRQRANVPLPALIVLSLKLPQTGGLQISEQIKENLKAARQSALSVAVIIDPENHNVPLAVRAYRAGVHAFLKRPIGQEDFCSLMSQFPALAMSGCCDVNPATKPQTIATIPSTPDRSSTDRELTAPQRSIIRAAD